MNRLILAIAILIPLATVFFVTTTSKRKKAEAEKQATQQVADPETDVEPVKELAIEITNENFEELVATSGKPVLLDFWAPWCGPCMMLGPHVEEIASDYEGKLVVGKVNTDEQKELAVKYKAASIPLVVVIQDGEVVGQVAGFDSSTPGEIRKIVTGLIQE